METGPLRGLVDKLNQNLAWHRLPKVFGLLGLVEIRNELREHNLHDTEHPPFEPVDPSSPTPEESRRYRTYDGLHNDLNTPRMGAVGTRFGRNFPLDKCCPDEANLMNPSPRLISQRLFTRTEFQPVPFLNLLAASWIQFQVHDWFAHVDGVPEDSHDVPLPPGDTWPGGRMGVPKTPVADRHPKGCPVFANRNTHWWDGSQIYACDSGAQRKLRTGSGGKMKIGDTALLPMEAEGVELTGFNDNWWMGLSMLHLLFVKEHNSICDRLAIEHSDWSNDQLFEQARLINCAVMAKIHTVDWTPAILPHPTVQAAMQINWSGIAGDEWQDVFDFINHQELLGGIMGSETEHHGAPYSLTEEFGSVYRLHSLIPDDYAFHSLTTGQKLGEEKFFDISLKRTRNAMQKYEMKDLFYSFGISHPGMIRLHNFPTHLQQHTKDDGSVFDLAAVDVLRDRERGVPRYNEFRRLLRMKPVTSFDEITDNPEWAREIEEVYSGDLEMVDLQVGLHCEPLLPGFGFSETAFRIFVLMASRRLKSDRFFTKDFTPEVYTDAGIDWVRDANFKTVLLRHFPSLAPVLEGVDNAFNPWKTV